MTEPEPARPAIPAYAWRAAAVTVLLILAATISAMSMEKDGTTRYAHVAAVTFAVLAAIVAGLTIVCVRQDAMRRDTAALAARLDRIDEDTLDLTNTAAGLSGEVEGLKALLGDFIKRYPPVQGTERSPRRRRPRRGGPAFAAQFVDGLIKSEGLPDLRLIKGDERTGTDGPRRDPGSKR